MRTNNVHLDGHVEIAFSAVLRGQDSQGAVVCKAICGEIARIESKYSVDALALGKVDQRRICNLRPQFLILAKERHHPRDRVLPYGQNAN